MLKRNSVLFGPGLDPPPVSRKRRSIAVGFICRRLWYLIGKTKFGLLLVKHYLTKALQSLSPHVCEFQVPYSLIKGHYQEKLVLDVETLRIQNWLRSKAILNDEYIALKDCFVGGGDWSQIIEPLTASKLHTEAYEVYKFRLNFLEIPTYQRLCKMIKKNHQVLHNYCLLKNEEDLKSYFEHYLAVLESIERHGLVRQNKFSPSELGWKRKKARTYWHEDIGVAVGHDGELYRFRGGTHRFVFARCLGIKWIPVTVKIIHINWLKHVMDVTRLSPHDAIVNGISLLSKTAKL